MRPDPLNIHIDLAALQATFFRRLQHQLDVTKVLQVGCERVTAAQAIEAYGRSLGIQFPPSPSEA